MRKSFDVMVIGGGHAGCEAAAAAARLGREIGTVRYTAVRREHNELADRLVNEALDSA